MTIEPIKWTLKDGRTAEIRSPRDEDIQPMIDYLVISAGETEFLLRYPEECGMYTPENEKAVIDRMNASETECMLVCVVDGKFAGNCNIGWSRYMKIRHRASIGIALLKEYWGLGLGTAMFEAMESIARKHENILQMELEFIEGNSRARALYEKMGFRIVGMRPDAIMLKDGRLVSEYIMSKKIER